MTKIKRVQTILFNAFRKAARIVDQDTHGASLLTVMIGEALAAVATEFAAQGTVLRETGGVDKVVRATVDPIEKLLRENIAKYLADEGKATRQ